MKVVDNMASIFQKLFGNKEVDNTLTNIDTISQTYFKHAVDAQTYDTLSKNAINDAVKIYKDKEKDISSGPKNPLETILSDIQVPTERLNRYEVYDHLYKSVQLIKRILTVYINNVFQKDTINNEILIISEKSNVTTMSESRPMQSHVRSVVKYFQIDKKIKYHTGFNVLKYGDSFIEVIDYTQVNVAFPVIGKGESKSEAVVLEQIVSIIKDAPSKNKYKRQNKGSDSYVKGMVSILCEFKDTIVESSMDTNFHALFEDTAVKGTGEFFNSDKLKNIILKFHIPHKIIPLITPFESILGYVELSNVERKTNSNSSNYFKEIVQQFNTAGADPNKKSDIDTIHKFGKEIVKTILTNNGIASKEDETEEEYITAIHDKIGDDLFNSLKFLLLSESNLFKHKLKVRFIKTENMFWFKTPSSDYYPFGRSIIDPLVFPGKMYLFNQLANNITKLSKSASIRKWTVNTSAVLKFC